MSALPCPVPHPRLVCVTSRRSADKWSHTIQYNQGSESRTLVVLRERRLAGRSLTWKSMASVQNELPMLDASLVCSLILRGVVSTRSRGHICEP